jgi:hypothetical protein
MMRLLEIEDGKGKLKEKRIDTPVVRKGLLARITDFVGEIQRNPPRRRLSC